jgi:hypothetical protein
MAVLISLAHFKRADDLNIYVQHVEQEVSIEYFQVICDYIEIFLSFNSIFCIATALRA